MISNNVQWFKESVWVPLERVSLELVLITAYYLILRIKVGISPLITAYYWLILLNSRGTLTDSMIIGVVYIVCRLYVGKLL